MIIISSHESYCSVTWKQSQFDDSKVKHIFFIKSICSLVCVCSDWSVLKCPMSKPFEIPLIIILTLNIIKAELRRSLALRCSNRKNWHIYKLWPMNRQRCTSITSRLVVRPGFWSVSCNPPTLSVLGFLFNERKVPNRISSLMPREKVW